MKNALFPGDRVVVNKMSYWKDLPQRGDIIVFDPPFDSSVPNIKRVIGLPCDQVSISNNGVIVNGMKLDESYVQSDMLVYGSDTWIVTEDSRFMMEDYRNNSTDSRVRGLMPVEYIIGKSAMVYWPPIQWSALSSTVLAAAPH